MILKDKYLKKIDLKSINFRTDWRGGYLHLNSYVKDTPLKSVRQLNFNSLYPNLIQQISLLDFDFNHDQKTQKEIDKFVNTWKFFENNKIHLKRFDPERYLKIKTEINRFYGRISYFTPSYNIIISEYLKHYYEDLIQVNGKKILYIDTDTVFFIQDIDLLEFGISYDIIDIEYIMFLKNKRYILKKTEIETRGGGKNFQEAIDVLKRFIRDDKIKELGL
jgi:hypothetical protein